MAEKTPQKKTRRLRAAPQTMRERAEKNQVPSRSRFTWVARVFRPLRVVGRLGRLPVWKPFRFVGRMLTRFLVPPYLRTSFQELRKVTWPTRAQTFRLTSAVILFAVVFGIVVAIADFGLDKLFKQVILR